MELKQFDYAKNPYTSSKVYDIHPLSGDGFSQYISNDSYTHKFIKNKFDAKILEKTYGIETTRPSTAQHNFYNSKDKLNSNYETFRNQSNQNYNSNNYNETNNKDKLNNLELKKNIETLKSELLSNNNNNNNFNNTTNNFNKNDYIDEINFNSNNNFNNNYDNNVEEDFRSQSKRSSYSSYNRINNNKTDLSKTNYSSSRGNKTNLIKFLSMKKNLNKKHNPKDNIRWETNYASNIAYLKKNQNLLFDFNPHEENSNYYTRKKKHDGFESFNIPRLENIKSDASKPASQYTQRLVKSCIGRRKEISINNNINDNGNINDDNNNNFIKNHHTNFIENELMIVEKIKEENQKLKNILNTQTNKDFLNRGNMPKISNIALQPKLVIKKFGLGGEGKFLGTMYNPGNFQTGRGNDRNRRNYVGGLYLN